MVKAEDIIKRLQEINDEELEKIEKRRGEILTKIERLTKEYNQITEDAHNIAFERTRKEFIGEK